MARKQRKGLDNLFGNKEQEQDVEAVETVTAEAPVVEAVAVELDISTGWLTIKDSAEYTGKSPHYLRHLGKYGQIEQRKDGGKVELSVASLDAYVAAQATKEAQKSEDFALTAETTGRVDLKVIAKFYGVNTNSVRNWAKAGTIPASKDLDSGRWSADAQEIFAHPKPAGGSVNGAGGRGKTADNRTFYMLRLNAEEFAEVEARYGSDDHKLQSRYAQQKASKAKAEAATADAVTAPEAVEA